MNMLSLLSRRSGAVAAGAVLLALTLGGPAVHAQSAAPAAPASAGNAGANPSGVMQQSIAYWLERLHQASRNRAYVGTFVYLQNS